MGHPLPKVPSLSQPAALPVPGGKQGSCVRREEGPSAPPGTRGRDLGTRRLHLEGAPISSLMVSEAESRGSPSAPSGGGISTDGERGAGGHGALPSPHGRGSRASPRRGLRVGVGTPRGPASTRPVAGAPVVRAAAPHPQSAPRSPTVPPLFLRPVQSRHRPWLNPFPVGLAAAGETRGLRPRRGI